MDAVFIKALAFTLEAEGGVNADPDDPGNKSGGGVTNHGIVQDTYSRWLATKGLPDAPVTQISVQEVQSVYYDLCWTPLTIGLLAEVLPACATALFDSALNVIHPREMIKMFQRRAGVSTVDGFIGPSTCKNAQVASIAAGGDVALALQYNQDRRAWIEQHSRPADVHGLKNRMNNLDTYLMANFQHNNGTEPV